MNKNSQPTLYKIIENSIHENKLSHAYLLVGNNALNSAKWLAASIMTHSTDTALLQERLEAFNNGSSVDFVLIDGSESTIKKEAILKIQEQFNKTALEKFNQKVVIFHQCHQASSSALNSILKFVEEPEGQTTSFIFTTDSLQLVMPTIQSRCVVITLDTDQKIYEDTDDWKLRYAIHQSDSQEQKDQFLADQNNQDVFQFIDYFFNELDKNVDVALVGLQTKNFDSKKISLFFSIICYILREGLYGRLKTYKSTEIDSQLYLIFTNLLSKINPSTNINLLVDEGCYRIREVLK